MSKREATPRRKTYHAWRDLRRRCNDPNNKDYRLYGQRGIRVAKRWNRFDAFLADVGLPPTQQHTIDCANNNRGYFPGNVRWATRAEQCRNRRAVKLSPEKVIEIRAIAKAVRHRDIAARFGVSLSAIEKIIYRQRWQDIGADVQIARAA